LNARRCGSPLDSQAGGCYPCKMQWVVYDTLADTIPRQEFGHFVVGAVSRHRTSGFDTFPRLPRKRHRFSNIFGRYSVFFFIFDRGRESSQMRSLPTPPSIASRPRPQDSYGAQQHAYRGAGVPSPQRSPPQFSFNGGSCRFQTALQR
jgi:hypothetical protein